MSALLPVCVGSFSAVRSGCGAVVVVSGLELLAGGWLEEGSWTGAGLELVFWLGMFVWRQLAGTGGSLESAPGCVRGGSPRGKGCVVFQQVYWEFGWMWSASERWAQGVVWSSVWRVG